jgi:hypothetical protein
LAVVPEATTRLPSGAVSFDYQSAMTSAVPSPTRMWRVVLVMVGWCSTA